VCVQDLLGSGGISASDDVGNGLWAVADMSTSRRSPAALMITARIGTSSCRQVLRSTELPDSWHNRRWRPRSASTSSGRHGQQDLRDHGGQADQGARGEQEAGGRGEAGGQQGQAGHREHYGDQRAARQPVPERDQ